MNFSVRKNGTFLLIQSSALLKLHLHTNENDEFEGK